VSAFTLKLIQIGFLVLLWLMVLSVAAVMRTDMFARRRTRAPKPPKPSKPAKSKAKAAAAVPVTVPPVGVAASAATAAAAPVPGPAKPTSKQKPKRGAPRNLVIVSGAGEGTTVELGANPISIGRSPGNTLVLEDDYVSGRHARLYPHEGAWVVEDLGSTNGTYMDRARLTAPMVLPVGTPVRIGKSILELRK
jgi:hypothetical protein